jgi:hypothetical protein
VSIIGRDRVHSAVKKAAPLLAQATSLVRTCGSLRLAHSEILKWLLKSSKIFLKSADYLSCSAPAHQITALDIGCGEIAKLGFAFSDFCRMPALRAF